MASEAKGVGARAAVDLVEDGMRLGLGTGSTVAHFLDGLAESGLDVAGVPTSEQTAEQCRRLGIPLLDMEATAGVDLCVDGADELTPGLALTKGGGGALLREKVVAAMADRMVVIATPDKVVESLGDSFPLPVEVVPFAAGPVTRRLASLGFSVQRRDDGIYRTDNGNAILDCHIPGGIENPEELDVTLALVPGIAEHGLFVDLATEAILGHDDGTIERLTA